MVHGGLNYSFMTYSEDCCLPMDTKWLNHSVIHKWMAMSSSLKRTQKEW